MVVTEDQVNRVRQQLEKQLEDMKIDIHEIDEDVRAVAADHDLGEGVDNHIGDDSDIVYEQERLLTVREELNNRRVRIEQALKKMDKGTWGTCESCGNPIPAERLEALPFVTLCISCQEIQDRRGDGRR